MNKQEAYQALLDGYTIRNEYYSKEEWLKMNEKGEIKTEEGYTMHIDDWNRYQDPNQTYEWEIVSDGDKVLHANKSYIFDNPYKEIYDFNRAMLDDGLSKAERYAHIVPVKPKNLINRNDLCPCNSGLKYKKCCL